MNLFLIDWIWGVEREQKRMVDRYDDICQFEINQIFFAGKWPKTFENSIGIPYDALFWSFVCKNMNLFFKRTISFPALKISILLMVLSYVAAEVCWERGELVNEWCVQIFFQNENTMWRCEAVFETKHFLISVSYSLNAIARPLYLRLGLGY